MLAFDYFIYNKGTGDFTRRADFKRFNAEKAAYNLMEVWPHGALSLSQARVELEKIKEIGLHPDEIRVEKQKQKQKSESVDWSSIYNAVQPLIRIRFYIGHHKKRFVYFFNNNKEIELVKYESPRDIEEALFGDDESWQALKNFYNTNSMLEEHKSKLTFSKFVNIIINEYLLKDDTLKINYEPKALSWEPDEFAFKKIQPNLLVQRKTPTWDEFTSRLDYPELFMAWVWSIIEPSNTVRQVCWIQGGGQDGKSAVQKALESVIGEKQSYSMKKSDLDSQFFLGSVFGKVLISFPDCNYAALLKHDYIKQITGGDSASIERKSEQSKSGTLKAKVFVHSNKPPKINPESRFQTTRLLRLTLKPTSTRDADFETRLKQEVWSFLANCKPFYDKHIADGHDNIKIPDEAFKEMMISCSGDSYKIMKLFESVHIEYGADYEAKYSNVMERLHKFRDDNFLSKDEMHFMKEEWNEVLREKGIETHSTIDADLLGYRGFRLKGVKNGN